MKFKINAILKTSTPLHISGTGAFRLDSSTGYVVPETEGNKGSMTPCTGVQKMRTVNSKYALPVIAANNFSGRMRRHVAERVLRAVTAGGKKVSLQAYSSLICGAVGGAPDKRDLTSAEFKRSEDHPYLGLMGGGPRMLRRKARVHNSVPVTQENIELLGDLMHPNARDYVQEGSFTSGWTFIHKDDLRELSNIALQEASIENYLPEINARQAAILAERGKGERSTTSTNAFSSLEFVNPGTHFNMLIELDCNPAQAGLYLLALDDFVSKERLGGHSANGFGAFSLKDVIMTVDEADPTVIFDNGRLDQTCEAVGPLLAAWNNAAGNIDVASIEEMMTLPADYETKAQKDAKKAAKKTGQSTASA